MKQWTVLMVVLALSAGAQAGLFQVVDGDFESAAAFGESGTIDGSNLNEGWYADGATVKESDGGNTYVRLGSPASGGFHQAIPTTDVTGVMQLRFDVKVVNSETDGNAAPGLVVGMWGETNPWNSLFGGSSPGINHNKPSPDILPSVDDDLSAVVKGDLPKVEVDLSLANGDTWTTYSYAIDMGSGFNHSQGGSAGEEIAYLAFGFTDVYEWAGDRLFVDNVRFVVPEPATMSLLALGGLVLARRRR